MIALIYIVMLLAAISVISKLSLMRLWEVMIYGAIYLIFSWVIHPYTITSSRNEVEAYLSNPIARQYAAILITIECAIIIAYAFRRYRKPWDEKRETISQRVKRQIDIVFIYVEKYYVTLLFLPTLFFVQTQVIYALPGSSFKTSAFLVGLGALLLCVIGSCLLKFLLPDRETREEFVLLTSILMCITALLSTNTQIMKFAPAHSSQIMDTHTRIAIGGLLGLFIIGFFVGQVKKYQIKKK